MKLAKMKTDLAKSASKFQDAKFQPVIEIDRRIGEEKERLDKKRREVLDEYGEDTEVVLRSDWRADLAKKNAKENEAAENMRRVEEARILRLQKEEEKRLHELKMQQERETMKMHKEEIISRKMNRRRREDEAALAAAIKEEEEAYLREIEAARLKDERQRVGKVLKTLKVRQEVESEQAVRQIERTHAAALRAMKIPRAKDKITKKPPKWLAEENVTSRSHWYQVEWDWTPDKAADECVAFMPERNLPQKPHKNEITVTYHEGTVLPKHLLRRPEQPQEANSFHVPLTPFCQHPIKGALTTDPQEVLDEIWRAEEAKKHKDAEDAEKAEQAALEAEMLGEKVTKVARKASAAGGGRKGSASAAEGRKGSSSSIDGSRVPATPQEKQ
jgi:hypothetical protein